MSAAADRRRPMARAAALGLGLSCLPPLHPSDLTPARVAGFLLFNPALSALGAISACARSSGALTELKSRYALRGGNDVAEGLDQLRAILASALDRGGPRRRAARVHRLHPALPDRHHRPAVGAAFFGHELPAEPARASVARVGRPCSSAQMPSRAVASLDQLSADAAPDRPPRHDLPLQAAGRRSASTG